MSLITTLREKGLSRLLLGGGLFFLLVQHVAAVDADLTIDKTRFSAPVLAVMLELSRRDDPALAEEAFLESITENHVVADYLRNNSLTNAALGENPVGFSADVQLENRLVSTLRAAFPEALAEAAAKYIDSNPMSMLAEPLDTGNAKLVALLHRDQRLVYQLNDREWQAARTLLLGHYRLPGEARTESLTFADIYERQNVQGRIALHEGEAGWLARETHLYLAQRFVLWWARNHSPLGQDGLDSMALLIEDQMLRQGWLAHSGVSAEIHAGNPALKARAAEVTDADIRNWYTNHQTRFREVREVTFWQLRCERKADCDQAAALLAQGRDFTDLAEQFAGRLGMVFSKAPLTVARGDGKLPWRDAVALMQTPEQVSMPLHAPGGDGWYLFKALSRKWHQYPAESRTVRAVARREIAQQALIEDYQALRARLLAQANIRRPAP